MAEEPIKPTLVGVQESCSAGYGDTRKHTVHTIVIYSLAAGCPYA